MLEAEKAYVTDIYDLTNLVERMIKITTKKLLELSVNDIQLCVDKFGPKDLTWVDKGNWIHLNYDKAYDILNKNIKKLTTVLKPNEGFSKEQELLLVEYCKSPVFVINWPKHCKHFYMKECKDNMSRVSAFDLLMPDVGELVGGSLRQDNYKILEKEYSGWTEMGI